MLNFKQGFCLRPFLKWGAGLVDMSARQKGKNLKGSNGGSTLEGCQSMTEFKMHEWYKEYLWLVLTHAFTHHNWWTQELPHISCEEKYSLEIDMLALNIYKLKGFSVTFATTLLITRMWVLWLLNTQLVRTCCIPSMIFISLKATGPSVNLLFVVDCYRTSMIKHEVSSSEREKEHGMCASMPKRITLMMLATRTEGSWSQKQQSFHKKSWMYWIGSSRLAML